MKSRPITIIVPVYNGWEYAAKCIASLRRHARSAAKILLINDASTDESMERSILNAIKGENRFEYHRNSKNLGFVRTCNQGVYELDGTDNDILLLNSDTEVTEGFLEEMTACLYSFEKHAVCCPRSNNATIMTIPPYFSGKKERFAALSYRCWKALAPTYRRYDVMPTAVGFCMLIRRSIIESFGLFDEAYGRGYNEENDFCARINRYGYSVVRANRAYVFHHESQSFGEERKELENRNRRMLLERYPEYWPAVTNYSDWRRDAVDHFADILGGCYPRKRILYDLTRLVAVHNGTNEQALSVLQHSYPILSKKYDVTIAISRSADEFLGVSSDYSRVVYEDQLAPTAHFDLAFVPYQLFEYNHLFRLNRQAVRIAVNILDIISIRTNYLQQISYENIFRLVLQWSDGLVSISRFSMDDYMKYYGEKLFRRFARRAKPILISKTDQRENAQRISYPTLPRDFVLILGNKFHHKAVLRALQEMGTRYPVVVVGELEKDMLKKHITYFKSGQLTEEFIEELYRRCKVLLFPSQYEGFGLPVLNAVLHGKPVILQRSQVNEEILEVLSHQNEIVYFDTFPEIPGLLARFYEKGNDLTLKPGRLSRTWSDVGRETAEFLVAIISEKVDLQRLQERFFELKAIEHHGALCSLTGNPRYRTPSDVTAQLQAIERSYSYRIGRFITFPFGKIIDLVLPSLGRSSFGLFRRMHGLGRRLIYGDNGT